MTKPSRVFTVVVEFRVTDRTDAHLTSRDAIKAEVVSWLTDLNAEVELIEVEEESDEGGHLRAQVHEGMEESRE